MPKFFHIVAALSLLVLLSWNISCNNSDSGGSEAPAYDVSGFWEGTLTPDGGGAQDRFLITLTFEGKDADDGSIQADVRFCDPASMAPCGILGFQSRCPEPSPFLSGTVYGNQLLGNVRGSRFDFFEVDIEYSDIDTGSGRYEYVESEGTCVGEVGDIAISRRVFNN